MLGVEILCCDLVFGSLELDLGYHVLTRFGQFRPNRPKPDHGFNPRIRIPHVKTPDIRGFRGVHLGVHFWGSLAWGLERVPPRSLGIWDPTTSRDGPKTGYLLDPRSGGLGVGVSLYSIPARAW